MQPREGEVFDTAEAGQQRVLGYSLAAGFQTVGGQASTKIRKNIWCLHHGEKTRDDRDLSHHIEKDSKGKIISTRKREDTREWAKNCKWRCYLIPCLEVDDKGNELNRWILRYGTSRGDSLITDRHSHDFAENALVFPKHRITQPAFQQALPQATAMRTSHLSYRQAERILHGQNLRIDRNSYYNLARKQPMDLNPDGLLALVTVLERDQWVYRTYWEFIRDELGQVKQQVLKAVFFTNNSLMKLARRFTPDWMIQVDGTFNTNRIRMPLIDCLGVSNTGGSFIFAFCFVTSESSENWGFVLQCLEQTVYDGLPLPRVVIADQGLGLRSVFASVWPDSVLQFCEWHAAQNVKKRLATQRYKKEEREAIMLLVWAYIWSASEEQLEERRSIMLAAMRPLERTYIETHWKPKEVQVIRLYTASNPNLNCFSSQREEGMHPMVKTILNHQLRLDEAVQRLASEMDLAVDRLQEAEQMDKAHNRRVLEGNTWYVIREVVASWPLVKVEGQWAQLAKFKAAGKELLPCDCKLVELLGLPCMHYLERAFDEFIPLPLTLIHSRWWYRGGIETRANWRPTYAGLPRAETAQITLERPSTEIISATNQLLEFRQTLNKEQQERLDEDQVRSTSRILADSRARQQFSSVIPRVLPAPILSTWDRRAKSHDKSSKRMMTGAEAAEKDADKQEKVEEQRVKEKAELQRIAEAAIDDELLTGMPEDEENEEDEEDNSEVANEIVFATPISPPRGLILPPSGRPITPENTRKRTLTLVHRTPDKPRAAPVEPRTPSTSSTSKAQELPPTPPEAPASTAPARLDGRPRREGKNSEYNRAIVIERGQERGGRGRGRRA
jgi:hypothetical protein